PPKLLDRLRAACRVRHLSPRTEDAYHDWCRRFILYHGKRHPQEMGAAETNRFLTHLAADRGVSASTQNQAFNALVFLYRVVLGADPGRIAGAIRAARPKRLPVVLTRDEVRAVLGRLDGTPRLVGLLLYGSGLRLLDALRLRVHHLDFARDEVLVRDGKGGKDRRTVLPAAAKAGLLDRLDRLRPYYERDVRDGVGVSLPDAVGRKYPRAAAERGWYYVFPARQRGVDRRDGRVERHHLHETAIQRAVEAAGRAAAAGGHPGDPAGIGCGGHPRRGAGSAG